MRRIACTFCALLGALAFVNIPPAAPALAAETTLGEWKYMELSDGTVKAHYLGASESVEVPDTLAGLKVTGVYGGFGQAVHVVVSEGVTFIDEWAFCECKKLVSVSLPSTLEYIGAEAFAGSALTEITVPAGVKSVADYAFQNCAALTDITFLGRDVSIGSEFPTYTVPARTRIHAACGSSAQHFASLYGYPFTSTAHLAGSWQLRSRASARSKTDGLRVRACTACGEVVESRAIPYPAAVVLSSASFSYNAKAHVPKVLAVTDRTGAAIPSSSYTTELASDGKRVGYHELAVDFSGEYLGTLYAGFSVTPKGTALKKLQHDAARHAQGGRAGLAAPAAVLHGGRRRVPHARAGGCGGVGRRVPERHHRAYRLRGHTRDLVAERGCAPCGCRAGNWKLRGNLSEAANA